MTAAHLRVTTKEHDAAADRAAGCQGKPAHASFEAANRAAKSGGYVRPYRCGFCNSWHTAGDKNKRWAR